MTIKQLPILLALVSALAISVPVVAPAADDGLALEDLHRIQSVSALSVSPDGEAIAFLRSVPRDPYAGDDGPARQELHLARGPDDTRRFVSRLDGLGRVDWHPDGRHISFLATPAEGEDRALHVIPADGGEAVVVLEHDGGISDYRWAPDGESVAFTATEPEHPDDEQLDELGFNVRIWEEGHRMSQLFIVDAPDLSGAADDGNDGNEESNEREPLGIDGSVSDIRFAPDGRHLALMAAPTPLIDDHFMLRRIHVVDTATGDLVQTIEHTGKKGAPVFSPDGEHLAFVGAVDINDPSEGRLMVAAIADGQPEEIHPAFPGHLQAVDWVNAGTLVWLGHHGVRAEIGTIGIDGDGPTALADPHGPVAHAMDQAGPGGRLAFIADAPEHPNELFVLEDGELERWTNSNPWLDEVRLARQEVIRHEARDGLELEGILIHPLDGAGEPAPLILSVHGGPEAHDHHGWNTSYAHLGQVAAARGFAVFYPNYRGSTGRGVAFSKMGQGEPAGAEFDDIVDARNHLIDTGVAREGQIGITGRSYGGYAASWGATALSEYFDASVVSVGAAENLSKFGTSDITRELYEVHLRSWPWEDWEMYIESSPIYHIENADTPTLILHGEQDARVHMSQGMILHRYLKLVSEAPVRLVTYPDEAHGTSNATSQRDYAMRLMRWMEHFLIDQSDDLPTLRLDHSAWLEDTNGDNTDT